MKIKQRIQERVLSSCLLILVASLLVFAWAPAGALGAPGKPPDPTPEGNEPGDNPILIAPEEKITGPADFATPAGPDNTQAIDSYGYAWNDGVALSWYDASGGTELFPAGGGGVDDFTSAPIALPWSFPFYENSFSQLYISSNGLLGFNNSIAEKLSSVENLQIPFDYEFPNDIIAPFWDDLLIGGASNDGKVYYDTGSDGNGAFFVVEWYQVNRSNPDEAGELLTFEALLYQNGDILFQYQFLDTDATLDSSTVGIEDGDGIDGLQYQFNTEAIASGDAILFTRPTANHRVKVLPRQASAFTTAGQAAFNIMVRNTGNLSADIFNLTAVASDPTWQVSFYDGPGDTLLGDSPGDPDGIVDTGSLGIGETISVTVKVQAPEGITAADGVNITLTATSTNNGAKTQDVALSTVIPAPFIVTYRESSDIFAEAFWQDRNYPIVEHELYTGSSFSLAQAGYPNYFGIWEKNHGSDYTDLVYNFVNSTGGLVYADRYITNFSSADPYRDTQPMAAMAPNGNIGVTWVRTETRFGNPAKTRINIYFTLLDAAGNYIFPHESPTWDHVLNVTEAGWYTGTELDVLQYDNPRITAIGDRFHLAWIEKHIIGDTTSTDIVHSVYESDVYGIVKARALFTSFNPSDEIDYVAPNLAAYENSSAQDLVMLAYFKNDNSGGGAVNNLVYALLTPDGETTSPGQPAAMMYSANGLGLDIAQLSNDKVALAWTDADTNKVTYVIVNQDLSGPPAPTALDNPDNRLGGAVSVTYDDLGRAILTWMDSKWFGRLYYALVDYSGVLTPPMVYKYSQKALVNAIETRVVQGNAPYRPWFRIDMPFVVNP